MKNNTPNQEENLSGKEIQLVIFNLASEEYAIEIHNTKEIIEFQEITEIPNSPDYISGLINIRGKIISVFDLRKKFNLEAPQSKQILIAEINGEQFGLMIDEIVEIIKIDKNYIKPAPSSLSSKIHTEYLEGIATIKNRIIIVLNLEEIFTKTEMEEKTSIPKAKIEPKKEKIVNSKVEEKINEIKEEFTSPENPVEETVPEEPKEASADEPIEEPVVEKEEDQPTENPVEETVPEEPKEASADEPIEEPVVEKEEDQPTENPVEETVPEEPKEASADEIKKMLEEEMAK